MQQVLLVRYGEVFLKGANRPHFLKVLTDNIKRVVKPLGGHVWLSDSRVYVSQFTDLQACIDESAGRADCNMNVLILVGIEEALNLVSGSSPLACPPVEGNTDFAGYDKLIFHCALLFLRKGISICFK